MIFRAWEVQKYPKIITKIFLVYARFSSIFDHFVCFFGYHVARWCANAEIRSVCARTVTRARQSGEWHIWPHLCNFEAACLPAILFAISDIHENSC